MGVCGIEMRVIFPEITLSLQQSKERTTPIFTAQLSYKSVIGHALDVYVFMAFYYDLICGIN